ncbi:MAG: PQQ-binding-like beta-propeller repeat protein, partial [Planctomycetota bacterium]
MRIRIVSIVLATITILAAPALAEDYGGFRGPNHNGIYPAKNLLKEWPAGGPPLLWKIEDLGEAWGPPVVVGETVYVLGGCHPGKLHAFTLDGQKKWTKEYGPDFASRFDGSRSTITVSDGLVIFNSGKKDERSTYALDAETGETVWHVDGTERFGSKGQGWGWNASPVVYKDKVIADMRSKDDVCPPVVAVNKQTGETEWTTDPSPGDLSAGDQGPQPAIEGDDWIIVYTAWRALLGIDPDTGERLWRIKTSKAGGMAPVYKDGYLYTSHSGGTHMYRLDDFGEEPELLWSTGGIKAIAQAVIMDGKVYAFGSA